ncbi:MAG TPA: hypothetical protein DHR80_10470 [Thalassospira lucentensis]|uniref:Uncharacterized protein n=2 Tax=Thalassospira lucentensis TaxID=168935 RepID=A0A3D5NAD0_9PROT|nr:hypothetical protein [Thalassospira lucentensis]
MELDVRSVAKEPPFAVEINEEGENTLVEYMYRDSGNWKTWQTLVFEGVITQDQVDIIHKNLMHGEFFTPEDFGLPNVCDDPSDPMSFHEFCIIRTTTAVVDSGPINDFVDQFKEQLHKTNTSPTDRKIANMSENKRTLILSDIMRRHRLLSQKPWDEVTEASDV